MFEGTLASGEFKACPFGSELFKDPNFGRR
jgi:hypothetical protein